MQLEFSADLSPLDETETDTETLFDSPPSLALEVPRQWGEIP